MVAKPLFALHTDNNRFWEKGVYLQCQVSVSVGTLPHTPVHCGIEMSTSILTVHFILKKNAFNIRKILVIQNAKCFIKGVPLIYLVSFNMKIKCMICKIGSKLGIFKS